MDNGLPETIGEVKAEIQLHKTTEAICEALCNGARPEYAAVAARELIRVRDRLHKLRLREIKLTPQRKRQARK